MGWNASLSLQADHTSTSTGQRSAPIPVPFQASAKQVGASPNTCAAITSIGSSSAKRDCADIGDIRQSGDLVLPHGVIAQ